MGHNAKYGVYIMFCNSVSKLVHFELLQVSCNMFVQISIKICDFIVFMVVKPLASYWRVQHWDSILEHK